MGAFPSNMIGLKKVKTGQTPSKDTVWFVLVNFNGLADTLECLKSLADAGVPPRQIVVVDNASSGNDAVEISAAWPSVHCVCNDTNQGWAGGNNRGIEVALREEADWVFLLNNDTVVASDILEMMQLAIASGPWDILGPIINEYNAREVIQTEGVTFNPHDRGGFFVSCPIASVADTPLDVIQCDIVNGCAVAISRRVFESIGLIDERFFLICEESDFCLRAGKAGFRNGVLAKTLVWHKHSVSFARAGKPLQRYYGTRNLGLLLRKHPTGPGQKKRVRSQIEFYRLSYHMYCHERELGNQAGARAVIDGLVDNMFRRYGKQRPPWSLVSAPIDKFFGILWRLRGGTVQLSSVSRVQGTSAT